MEDKSHCPLTAQDAYELKFEMQKTREILEQHSKKMDAFHERIGKFEQLFYEGKGMAIGVKIGILVVILFIGSAASAVWAFATGRISFSDIFKIL